MNPTLRSFDTTITRIEKRKLVGSKATNARKKGGKTGKAVAEPLSITEASSNGNGTPTDAEWEIECEDTGKLPFTPLLLLYLPAMIYDTNEMIGMTVIFPEGGGQPCDHGSISLLSNTTTPAGAGANSERSHAITANVKEAFRQDLSAVHIAHFPSDFNPLANGWTVGAKVHMQVDWDRRTYRKSHISP